MKRKQFLAFAVASLAAPFVLAQTPYPNRPIMLIVPFPAGGAADVLARAAASAAALQLGQTIVIDNRPGAGGNIGVAAAANAAADGYTMLLGHISPMVINPHTFARMPVDPQKEFTPIGLISAGPMILVVHPSVPARNLQEFIAYAKANPDAINYASAGSGGITHVVMELLAREAGIRMTHVPYRGGAPALQDLLTGRVQAMNDSLPQLLPDAREGRLRAIAVTGAQRSVYAPDVPTAAESGLPGYVVSGWLGIFARTQTPPEILGRWKQALDAALASQAYIDFVARAMGTKPPPMTMEETAHFVRAEYDRWGQVTRDADIRAD